jgi:hypothetical protein
VVWKKLPGSCKRDEIIPLSSYLGYPQAFCNLRNMENCETGDTL